MAFNDSKSRRSSSRGSSTGRGRSHSRPRTRLTRYVPLGPSRPLTPDEIAAQLKREQEYQDLRAKTEQREREEEQARQDEARSLVGSLQSEVVSAMLRRERTELNEGDWLDDPVAAMITGRGFAEETTVRSGGVRLEIHLALDTSNSMVHNGCASSSRTALRVIYMALLQTSRLLPPGSLNVEAWAWAQGRDGSGTEHLSRPVREWEMSYGKRDEDTALNERLNEVPFNGEGTRIAPLFRSIYGWELDNGTGDAFRLDIILTDGVLDNRKDKKDADRVQAERNGHLQTVILNFLPSNEWDDSEVPDRCVQYEATPENVFGLLRKVTGEWIGGI